MKKVAIIQSNYIPWKGYFDIIHDVDRFIFYDDVQFTKNDWRNRNRIKTVNGPVWLTIPVGKRLDRLICEVELTDDGWRKKHWSTIQQAYSKAPYFKMYRDFFEYVYHEAQWPSLSELNQFLIRHISGEFLGLKTEFQDSREFHAHGEKLNRLIDLLKKADASLYVSGPSAQAYIDDNAFRNAGIELVYKEYAGYPEYQQLYPPFEHGVSILDLLFNCGSATPDFIWGWRSKDTSRKK